MVEYLFGMAVNIVLTTIAMALKDPNKAAQYKKALLKIKMQIELLFPGE